jgi:hypothetical protein
MSSNKNFQTEENEILSADDAKVCQMLDALARVDAPKDFDFRLKARIASRKSQDFKPRLSPILLYAAPLGLLIAVLAAVVINNLYSVDSRTTVPQVADNFTKPTIERINATESSQPGEKTIAASSSNQTNSVNPPANPEDSDKILTSPRDSELAVNPKNRKSEKFDSNSGGGSKDFAATNPGNIKPKGLNDIKPREAPKNFIVANPISVKEVLSVIGIEATFSDKKWKVESVRQNSQASSSGIRPNDVIEAIDESVLSNETIAPSATGTFSGKKLIVVRGAEKIEIKLQNK